MKSEQTNNSDVIDYAHGSAESSSVVNYSTAKTDCAFNSNASPFSVNKGKPNNLPIKSSSRTLPRFFTHDESSLHDPSKSSKFREKARELMKEAVVRSSGASDDFHLPNTSTLSTFAKISPTSTYPLNKACDDDTLHSNARRARGKSHSHLFAKEMHSLLQHNAIQFICTQFSSSLFSHFACHLILWSSLHYSLSIAVFSLSLSPSACLSRHREAVKRRPHLPTFHKFGSGEHLFVYPCLCRVCEEIAFTFLLLHSRQWSVFLFFP